MAGVRACSLAHKWGASGVALALCAGLLTAAAPAWASSSTGTTTRVSVATDGTPADWSSSESAISADGR